MPYSPRAASSQFLVSVAFAALFFSREVFSARLVSSHDNSNPVARCPEDTKQICSEAHKWLQAQRDLGFCRVPRLGGPIFPLNFRCTAGKVPTPQAYKQWKPDQSCLHYYVDRTCVFKNTQFLSNSVSVHNFRIFTGSRSDRCSEPVLGVGDCTAVQMVAQNLGKMSPKAPETRQEALVLADSLLELRERAPSEWIYLPTMRFAMLQLSSVLENLAAPWHSPVFEAAPRDDGETLGSIWRSLMLYCNDTEHRAISGREEDPLHDCNSTTQLNRLAMFHPAWHASTTSYKNASSLAALKDVGMMHLDAETWKVLARLAGGDGDATWAQLRKHVAHLVSTAAERGEDELELALATGMVDEEPARRQLREMYALRNLRNSLVSDNMDAMKDAVSYAEDTLGSSTSLRFVNSSSFETLLTSAMTRYKELERCSGEGASKDCTSPKVVLSKHLESTIKDSAMAFDEPEPLSTMSVTSAPAESSPSTSTATTTVSTTETTTTPTTTTTTTTTMEKSGASGKMTAAGPWKRLLPMAVGLAVSNFIYG